MSEIFRSDAASRLPKERPAPYDPARGDDVHQRKVSRAEGRSRPVDVEFIVDSGAISSVLPESVWKRLRLEGKREAYVTLADGTEITRPVSRCIFEIAGVSDVSPVVLGGPRDAPLLGMVTLETLGLMLNPLTRELLPMRLMLASLAPRAA